MGGIMEYAWEMRGFMGNDTLRPVAENYGKSVFLKANYP